jgi:hypothetical protein
MEHPTYEELFMHLEGSSSPEAAKRLQEHLENCPQCAAELAGWQRSVKRLQGCEWPERRAANPPAWGPRALKWAAAAALVLGLGFGLGRASGPSTAKLKDSIITEVRQQLRQEMRAGLSAAAAAAAPVPGAGFEQKLRREFDLALAASANKTANENRRLFQEAIQALRQKQDDHQRAVLQALARLEDQHAADYLSLRHDLETAASVTVFGNPDQKVVDQIAEDLRILSYLLSRNLERAFAGDSPDYVLGIPMLVTVNGHSVEASYLEGFGVVLRMRVGFPLAGSPGGERGPGAVRGVSEWDEARRALAGAEVPEGAIPGDWTQNSQRGYGFTGGEPQRYDPKLVETLKKRTLALLKNASNLRHLKPDEWIVVSITGQPGFGRRAARVYRSGGRQERRIIALVEDASASNRPAPGGDKADQPKSAGEASEAATLAGNDLSDLTRVTMMTIRVKKANADAFAAGRISEEQFAKEAETGTYLGPAPLARAIEGSRRYPLTR